MNFVAINLAHDIITGKRTVTEARDWQLLGTISTQVMTI
jgi:hypothetical protein